MLSKIFESLNASFFKSKLPVVKMGCFSFDEIKNEMIRRRVKDADNL